MRPVRAAAAVLVTAAAGGLAAPAPAALSAAAACPGTAGVTVVVESGALGAGTDVRCVSDGGGHSADRLLKDAGYSLDYVKRFPGFVCRIDGAPADDPCVNTPPADAYWGLWWSDGESGAWAYSSLGAASLTIPSGGFIAMVWDDAAGDVRPQTGAPAHPTPTPTPTATSKPTPTPAATPTPTASTAPTSQAAPSPSATKKPTPTRKPSPTAEQSPEPTANDPTSADPSDEQTEAGGVVEDPVDPAAASTDGGLPTWLAPLLVIMLLGAAGYVAVVRRRQS